MLDELHFCQNFSVGSSLCLLQLGRTSEFCQLVQAHEYQKDRLLKVASKHFPASYLESFGLAQFLWPPDRKLSIFFSEQAAKSDFGCRNR